jgi:hypothetical protein
MWKRKAYLLTVGQIRPRIFQISFERKHWQVNGLSEETLKGLDWTE